MRPLLTALLLTGFMLVAVVGAMAQQKETGPLTSGQSEHPIRNPETGTRGPSGASPETGYHGPRDVTKDAEPGKAKTPEEMRQTGQVPEKPTTNKN